MRPLHNLSNKIPVSISQYFFVEISCVLLHTEGKDNRPVFKTTPKRFTVYSFNFYGGKTTIQNIYNFLILTEVPTYLFYCLSFCPKQLNTNKDYNYGRKVIRKTSHVYL